MDFDAKFLQGLLPEVKAMNFHQKLQFKRRIYEVIGEIFENNSSSGNCKNSAQQCYSPTMQQHHLQTASEMQAFDVVPNAMTVINPQDLAMIRRLNSLLHSPNTTIASAASSTVTAVPKNVASISSTVRTTPPSNNATTHRGALTRSSSNSLRVNTLNSTPMPITSTQVKQEMQEIVDE